ncbi:hypothetical protein [Actinacidiphila acididurans]|uniref:Uncharacterized protein n=1 Tax=Actinacidiphila acididurans TaxID=2784346 RepID=A0ABS2U3X8_9ACTN|nr:hypothetical protein [Actinacidiphila acididurans]MBM9510314.1 hypothetical protein [Actinacidiphila acididurans]
MDTDTPHPPVVVHPASSGGRRVVIRGHDVGRALRRGDVEEFLRRAGLEDPDIDDPRLVEWRGGDSDAWP